MKKIIVTSLTLFLCGVLFSKTEFDIVKKPIAEGKVPKDVVLTFKKDHEAIETSKWFPYPYRFSLDDKSLNKNWYYSVVNLHESPDFYEVEYKQDGQIVRKVYGLDGNCKLTSTVFTPGSWPSEIKKHMSQPEFKDWKMISYELVRKGIYDVQVFHKIMLKKDDFTKVVYFDKNFELNKSRDWEVSVEKVAGKDVHLRTAYVGSRVQVDEKDLTWLVRMKLKDSLDRVKILEYWEAEPVHIPQQREVLEYYDLSLSPTYQVVYKDKKLIKKNTYDAHANLLETVELIKKDKWPSFVKKKCMDDRFNNWSFEDKAEKVTLDNGKFCYRLHAQKDNEEYVFVVYQD